MVIVPVNFMASFIAVVFLLNREFIIVIIVLVLHLIYCKSL